jgi:hypothetical protein
MQLNFQDFIRSRNFLDRSDNCLDKKEPVPEIASCGFSLTKDTRFEQALIH